MIIVMLKDRLGRQETQGKTLENRFSVSLLFFLPVIPAFLSGLVFLVTFSHLLSVLYN